MSAAPGGPGTGALDAIGAPVDLLALIVGGVATPLIGPPPGAELRALIPEFESERPGARRLAGGRLAVHVPLGDGRAHLWQVGDGDVALPHLIRALVRASRQIAFQNSAPVAAAPAENRWRMPLFQSLASLPKRLKTRRLVALERLAAATGWTGLAFIEIKGGRARKVHRLSPTADLRSDSLRIFANRMIAEDQLLLAVDARRIGDGPADLELFCEEHRISGFVVARPAEDGLALYVEGMPPPDEVVEAQAALSVAFPKRVRGTGGWVRHGLAAAAVVALIAFLAWPVRFEVTAPGELRPATSEIVIAAEEARLASVLVSVGQSVSTGDVIATLVSDPLDEARDEAALTQLLEGLSAQEALAAGDYARYQLAQQRQDIAALRVARLDQRIDALVLTAPQDGRIADLISRGEVGAMMNAGTSVAEVQVGNRMRALLRLAAIDAPLVRSGTEGTFVLRGISGRSWPVTIIEDPIASRREEGDVVLLVLAEIAEADAALFKGLTGIARLDLGERPRVAVLLRPLAEWVRLKAWEKLGIEL